MKLRKMIASGLAALMLAASGTIPVSAANAGTGDIDVNGYVNIADAILLARFNAEDTDITVTTEGKGNADLNADGQINADDLSTLLRTLANLDSEVNPDLKTETKDLLAGRRVERETGIALDDAFRTAQSELTVNLLRKCAQSDAGSNVMVSPLSVSIALAMTANGAKGQTKEEMEKLLGGTMTIDELNEYYASWLTLLNTEFNSLSAANSVWMRDDETMLHVPDAFLDKVSGYYGADLYSAAFDPQTVEDMNSWCNDKTDEMIPHVIDSLSDEAVMVLINALAFEGEWADKFDDYQVSEKKFTNLDGSESDCEMMYDTLWSYLKDDKATGFVKYYKGGEYGFAAMLPNEGVTLDDYLNSLDGASLAKLLANVDRDTEVNIGLPKFSFEYSKRIKGILSDLGMPTAFMPGTADFTGLNDAPGMDTWIGDVIHKTFIDVTQDGTRAAAVTAVIMEAGCAMREPPKEVILDRPFLYMIFDTQSNLPIFIGTVNSMNPQA